MQPIALFGEHELFTAQPIALAHQPGLFRMQPIALFGEHELFTAQTVALAHEPGLLRAQPIAFTARPRTHFAQ